MTVIAMSRPEIDRMHVLRDLAAGRMTVNEAAQLMRLTRRHVFRLAKAYRERGPSALVSTRRGQPSNHRYPAASVRELAKEPAYRRAVRRAGPGLVWLRPRRVPRPPAQPR